MAPPARAPATEIGPVTAHLSVSATAYLSGVKSSGDENEFPKPSTHSTSNRSPGCTVPSGAWSELYAYFACSARNRFIGGILSRSTGISPASDAHEEEHMESLTGQTAVVTGGANGVGRGIASILAREGARVAIADIDLAAAETVAGELPGKVTSTRRGRRRDRRHEHPDDGSHSVRHTGPRHHPGRQRGYLPARPPG